MSERHSVRVTGVGSLPGDDIDEACRVILGIGEEAPEGAQWLPYLPELPARGPWADTVARSVAMLAGMRVELADHGWRLVSGSAKDQHKAQRLLHRDVEALAPVWETHGPDTNRLKVQALGPMSLAASTWLRGLDQVLTDSHALVDVSQSLAEGLTEHLDAIRRVIPGVELVVQLDEPALPAIMAGKIPRSAGRGVLAPMFASVVAEGLRPVVESVRSYDGNEIVVHCCDAALDVALVAELGIAGVSLDLGVLDRAGWESVGEYVDGGGELWAGISTGEAPATQANSVVAPWRAMGLKNADMRQVTITPPCGLAGQPTVAIARQLHRDQLKTAVVVAEIADS